LLVGSTAARFSPSNFAQFIFITDHKNPPLFYTDVTKWFPFTAFARK
jgi:hypothetical protein